VLIPVRTFRGFTSHAAARPVFRSGVSVKIHAYVPHPCSVTFISVERIDAAERIYSVIGVDLLPGDLPAAGFHRLPQAEQLVITDCKGSSSLVMLAWAPRAGWQGIRPSERTRVVAAHELQEPLRSFQRLPAAERYVSVFDYDVR
jgi:hypothetical protein